jgi:hypothetical protein
MEQTDTTPQRMTVTSTWRSTHKPNEAEIVALTIRTDTALRSTSGRALGNTVTKDASADTESAAMATAGGRKATDTGMKIRADPNPANPYTTPAISVVATSAKSPTVSSAAERISGIYVRELVPGCVRRL